MPGPPLTHTEPQFRKGAGPCAHSTRGISWGGPSSAVSRSPGTIGPGGARPPGLRSNSLFLPTFARAEPGARGEGSASRESKDGGKSRPCFASPSHLPKAFPSEIVLHPHFPAASLSLHAVAGFGGVCNLQTGAAALLQTGEGRSLASRRGVCDARVAGRAWPGWAPTPWPLPPGHPRLLT